MGLGYKNRLGFPERRGGKKKFEGGGKKVKAVRGGRKIGKGEGKKVPCLPPGSKKRGKRVLPGTTTLKRNLRLGKEKLVGGSER